MPPRGASLGGKTVGSKDYDEAAKKGQKPKTTKVVKKKKPPIPVPSVEATWREPAPPKPKPKGPKPTPTMMDRDKGPKRPGHLPIEYEYLPVEQIVNRNLGVETKAERDRAQRYNQQRERRRRDAAREWKAAQKEARVERREYLRSLAPEHRRILLDGQKPQDFIFNGPKDDFSLGDIAGGAANLAVAGSKASIGYIDRVVTNWRTELSGGLSGRRAGMREDIDPEENDLLTVGGEALVGHDLMKAIRGEDFDPRMALVEAALLGIPIKGLPTTMTAALRTAIGVGNFTRLVRRGATVGDALKHAEWTKPVMTTRAARRAALRRDKALRSSSVLAGKLAGQGDGRIRNWIRNDPSEQRTFTRKSTDLDGTERALTVETPADLSRLGRSARARLDKHRGVLGYIPGITSEQKMVDKVLIQQAETLINKYAGVKAAVKLPRNAIGQVDWPAVYAVRTVLKGHNLGEVINRTAADLAAAEAKGDELGARSLLHHLNYFKASARYLDTDAEGRAVLHADAPEDLAKLRDSVTTAVDSREKILEDFDLLTEARARDRVLNEEKFYQGATHQPRNDFIQKELEAAPTRQQAVRVLTEHHPASAKRAVVMLDAMARSYYEGQQTAIKEAIEDLRHMALADPDDVATMNARYLAIRRLQAELENMSPAVFYDKFTGGVADELPHDVVAELTEEYGAQGQDWFFRLHDLMGDGDDAARSIADEIMKLGLKLPEELDTPEKLAEGIANVFRLAREGEAGKDWYPEAAEGVMRVSEHTGVPPKQVAQLFAIFSQAADTVANSTFVFDAIRQFQAHGDLFSGRFPVRQSEEALAVLQGGKWEGRKRSSFYANILRHIPGMEDEYAGTLKEMADLRGSETNPVTVDRWVVRMFADSLGDVPGAYYDTFEKIIQAMAKSRGWEPEQIQAAAWVAMKDAGLQAETAKGGRRTVRHVAGAEDAFQYGIRRQIEKEEAGLFDSEVYAITPEMKRQRNRAQKLVKAVNKEWGGFTVNRDLTPVDEVGYSVTMSLTETEYPLHGVTLADLDHFREKYADLLKDKRNKLGGFSDDANEAGDGTEVTYLSISRQFRRKADAMKFAREQGQETVYEYPKVDPKTGKKPKIGDGIRTGLTREEQTAIIQGLRDAEALPRAMQAPLPRPPAEREYDMLLGRAALEFNLTKQGKVPTASQKARAEEWLLRHAHEYPEEPLIKEWETAYDGRKLTDDEPAWMKDDRVQFRLARAHPQAGVAPVNPAGIADDLIGRKGQALAEQVKGYATAVKQLDRADIPTAFIKRVWNDKDMHVYDKIQIGLHLNRLSGGGLRGRAFPDIPGAEQMFDAQQMGGMYMGDRRMVVQSPSGRGIDMLHEFFHGAEGMALLPEGLLGDMREFVGAPRVGRSQDLTTSQAEDMADMWEAMFLGFNANESKLPGKLKKQMAKFSRAMQAGEQGKTGRAQAMLDKMPPEMRVHIEDALWYDAKAAKRSGMYGHGPDFTHRPGGRYIPEQAGLPFAFNNMFGPRRYEQLYNRLKNGRRVQTLTPTDQALEHQFTGRLLASGKWSRDVTAGPLHGLIKAIEIEKMHFLRTNVLESTTDIPRNVDDVAIPVDPAAFADSKDAPSELADLFAVFDVMDSGLPVNAQRLDAVTVNGIEQAKDYFFPGYSEITKADIEKIATPLLAPGAKPIPGIRWVPRQQLDRLGLADPPGLKAAFKSAYAKAGLEAVDQTNNILKLLTLSLNPSYYTMNLTGQAVMLLMQQGAFAPVSLARSLANLQKLSPDVRAVLQAHAGVGQASVISAEGMAGPVKGLVDMTQKFANAVIDTHPRMAAITYEARRLGYKTAAELEDLIMNPANAQDLFTASRRANRSMVDFQNMGYAEREYLGRLIFVYPWLRASAKWAAQFPFDHPIQAAAFVALLGWQQQRLQESFPEGHPGYLKWYFPLEGGDDPYGFRLDQAFTPLQPIDLAGEILWLTTGGRVPWGTNEEAAVSRLNPFLEEIITFVSGYDAFRQEEVQRNLLTMLRRMVDPEQRYASWSRIMKVKDRETHEGLYDTNMVQNWLRVILGSLAPVDVNPEVAAQMAAPTKTIRTPDVSDEETERVFMKDVQERAAAEGVEVPADLQEKHKAWALFNDKESEFKREYDLDPKKGLKVQEKLAVLLLTWGEIKGREADAEERMAKALAMSDEDAQAAYDEGREALGIALIERVKGRLGDAGTAEREVVKP